VNTLRVAARTLLRAPGFTILATLTLALGIGATTAIFSVIQAVILAPLPYPNADRVVVLSQVRKGLDLLVAPRDWQEWRRQSKSFDEMALWPEWRGSRSYMLPLKDHAEELVGTLAPSSFFKVFGVEALLGRGLLPEEDLPDGEPSAVISHALWQRSFSGDSNIVGRVITLDNFWRKTYTIVGVMPPGFDFPDKCDVWVSRSSNNDNLASLNHHFRVIASLKPGVSLKQAKAELSTLQSRIASASPNDDQVADRAKVTRLLDYEVGAQTRPSLMLLSGAVGFLLLISCANIANLLFARAAARRKEIAVRMALGAGRRQVLAQLFAENALLATGGGVFGILFACWALRILASLGSHLPRIGSVQLNFATLAVAIIASLLSAVIFGMAPAMQSLKSKLNESLREAGMDHGIKANRLRGAIVIAEVALTSMLLVGAGLMIKSFGRLQNVPLGFDPQRLVAAEFDLSATNYYDNGRDRAFFSGLMQRVAAHPEIESASGAWYLPVIGRAYGAEEMTIEARGQRPEEIMRAAWNAITPDYFKTVHTPLQQGREFTDADGPNADNFVIINEAFARRSFGDQNPIGRRIAMGARPFSRERDRQPHWREVIGVAQDLRPRLDIAPFPEVFFPYQTWPWQRCFLVVRSAANPGRVNKIIRDEVAALNPQQPLTSLRTFDQIIGQSTAQLRFRTLLLSAFSFAALFLAAIGLYGVMSYIVTQRTHEFGIRSALGARQADIVALVLRRGMMLVLVGGAIGLAGAVNISTLVQKLLFEVRALDASVFAIAAFVLLFVSIIGCYLPARRASNADPMNALRCL
jgi:putative ABC transport system permease protein